MYGGWKFSLKSSEGGKTRFVYASARSAADVVPSELFLGYLGLLMTWVYIDTGYTWWIKKIHYIENISMILRE